MRGVSLPHVAVAFVINRPRLTSAIIGPRTMDHLTSQLGAADVVPEDDAPDAIVEVVPPGTTFSFADRRLRTAVISIGVVERTSAPTALSVRAGSATAPGV